MRPAYEQFAGPDEMLRQIRRLSARTVIVDIEPLIAYWDGPQEELDRGIELLLEQISAVPSLLVVCFATNSARLPSRLPGSQGVQVIYRASARKPLRIAPYQQLPRPGAVVGDQILTDGLLAERLGYAFLHYRPPLGGAPIGPLLLNGCGQLLRPVLFARRQH